MPTGVGKTRGEKYADRLTPTGSRVVQGKHGGQGDLLSRSGALDVMMGGHERDPHSGMSSNGLGAGEKAAVDGIHDGLSGDLSSAEVAAVQTLDGVFAALDAVKLQEDFSGGRIGI